MIYYEGYKISLNDYNYDNGLHTKYVFYNIDNSDDPHLHGTGMSVEDCEKQIDELIW